MTLSLCVVAYNEAAYLPQLLDDFRAQSYPHDQIEIVLIDGGSVDDTKKLMAKFASEHDFASVLLLDNPKKLQAPGWNIAISQSTGDVIFRIDAHAKIPPDFVEKNMVHISNGEFVSGGKRPCLIVDETPWKRVLLQVESSLFGSNISSSRRGDKTKYVKTLFHGAYRREVFDSVGLFNEKLGRTEDNEMHYRIRQAGYRLHFDPNIISYQYAKSTLMAMCKQKCGNGYWIGLTVGVCPGCLSLYHFTPPVFVMAILFTSVLSLCGISLLTVLLWLCYGVVAIGMTVFTALKEKFTFATLLMPFLFLLLHICYGAGTLIGLLKMPFMRKKLRTVKTELESRTDE